MHEQPTTILSTRQHIGDELVLSIRTDRVLVLEAGRNTVLFFSPTEARELLEYLSGKHYYFPRKQNNQ